jgi:outer membrane receptor protein involved in Fe transport
MSLFRPFTQTSKQPAVSNEVPMRARLQQAALALSLFATAGFAVSALSPVASAQSAVTGGIGGTVTDASGAVVPGAQINVVNSGTAAKYSAVTDGQGHYTVGLLAPGAYKITATSAGLKSDTLVVTVVVGTTIPGDIKVTPTGDTTVIDINATNLPLVDTQNVALATTFNEQQIQELPTPGGDVTTVAFTLPGVVVNAGGSYGNFSSDGLPGISNLFVLNGFDNQDPFLNLNNSGSSNLTLGQGELAEATVIQNGYNSEYGRAAGAVINYTTKAGTNSFHGAADYNYNGTLLNANGWFNQYEGLPRPHAVSNQWAANVGGPIIKDKVFFFGDYEGLRYVLPGSSGYLTFPSPQLESYITATVPTDAQSLYASAIADFHKSSAYANATPVTNGAGPNQDGTGNLGCGDAADGGLAGTPAPGGGTFGVDTPCMLVGVGSANNINKEWLFTGRADWKISDNHSIYGRYKMDRGSQPTSTSFIDPLFSAISIQPEYEGQFNDTYVFSPTKTNVLVAAANWYSAYFGPVNQAASLAELPVNFYYSDYGLDGSGVNSAPGLPSLGVPFYLTQGRNVTQYQISDDFRWIHGKHNLTFGANFRRDLVSDYDSQEEVVFPYETLFSLGDFASGTISSSSPYYGLNSYNQAFTATTTAHLALYNLGAYFQDEFQATPKLKLTMGVRIDRTGNPLCHNECFSNYTGAFPNGTAGYTSAYDAADGGPIQANNAHPFSKSDIINFQPRFGFNYSINDKTEIRGGAGLFSDLYPAVFVDGVIQNFPNYNAVTVYSGVNSINGAPGTVGANAVAANATTQQAFSTGGSITDINNALNAQGIPFSPPTINAYFPSEFHVPEYVEYSLQLQRQLSAHDAIIVTYAGNYGYNEILQNQYQNAASGNYSNTDGVFEGGAFAGVPVTPADPRFGRVTAYTNNAHSNYNGAMVSYKRNGHGLTGQISYTYSHSLDMISNGGVGEPFNGGAIQYQLTPALGTGNLNYSNSDYDIRNNLVGDLVYEEPFKTHNKIVNEGIAGWIVGIKTYARSGEPYSITNGAVLGNYHNLGTQLMPDLAAGVATRNITNPTASNPHSCAFTACLNIAQFGDAGSQADFGDLRRNSLYGPHYVNTDLSLSKKFAITERIAFSLGANAYNVFNHANFAAPVADTSLSDFGEIESTVAAPTSPYGSFQGAAVTQRLLQVHGRFTF